MWKTDFLDFVDEHEVGPYIRLSLTEGEKQSQIPAEASPVEKEQRDRANNNARNYMKSSICNEFISDIFSEIIGQINTNNMTGKELWDCAEWLVLATKGLLTGRELEAENSELKGKISILEAKTQQIVSVESSEEKISELKDANADLQKRLSDLEQLLAAKHKSDFETKEKSFAKKFSEFSRKCAEEKKEVELKCIKLSQQKNVGFFKEISGQRNDAEKGFEEERSIFETEIKKLTAKLSELSEKALKEQKTKSEFTKKIDLLVKERDNFASTIKVLEKSVSSSNQKSVSTQRSVKSFDQIRKTNLFYDSNIDGSGIHQKGRRYKDEELVWKKKPVEDELKEKESCVHAFNAKKNNASKGKPDHIYSRDQLLKLSGKKYHCSYCHTHDHIHKTIDHFWYGSYSISPTRTATNIRGPKYQWVPKPKTDSVLQAPTVKGE
ncbi:hypothetical protein L6452_08341 [Arctium lappa]|uniref:Uncharacterized protein n=1 Tax=Arctium lappa TaxID=4217 RepID=A0ACB9DGZ5_ARCLA|nr:hypothetical protein L6452_08341 [Arctium lappa]